MSFQRTVSVNFGRSRSGLATVAWSLDSGTTWSTAGVVEAPTSSGIYKATLTFPDAGGIVDWKTGEGDSTERFANESIQPDSGQALNVAVGGGTALQAIEAMAAVIAGKLGQSADGVTNTFSDFMDDATPRVTSTSSSTVRNVTIH